MAENSEDIAEILYSFVSATPSGTAGEKTLFNQNGDRRLVKLGTDIKYDNGTNVDKAVLTLLNKESKLYSLSIKVDKSKVVNLNSLKFKERRLYSSKTETYININLNQNINLSHVLFIGEVKQLGGNFKINKTILITKDVGKGQEQKYDDITDEEEYLNLHHIDYFSFMYDDFKKMYDEYKVKNERQQNPDSRKKINNAVNAVRASNRLKPLPKVQPAPEGAGAGAAAAAAGKKPVVEEEGGDKEEGGAGEEAARARAEEEAAVAAEQEAPRQEDEEEEDMDMEDEDEDDMDIEDEEEDEDEEEEDEDDEEEEEIEEEDESDLGDDESHKNEVIRFDNFFNK